MKTLKIVALVSGLFIGLPIQFYLMYRILIAVEATPVMWVLWVVSIPIAPFVQLVAKVAEGEEERL